MDWSMEKIEDILLKIDSLKSELDGLRPFDEDRMNKVEQTFRLWWNYHSNAIEGNQLTLGETKMLLMHGLTAKGKPLKDHEDIKGHNDVVQLLGGIISEGRPLNETLIRELHKALLREPYLVKAETPDGKPTSKMIKIGEYKTLPNNVRTSTGETHFYASPEETPSMMTDLIDWYNKSEQEELHPVLIAAYFHYKFVCIHPFDDGNGRMSRILMNLILIKHGYVPGILKIEDRNTTYIPALEDADTGNVEGFIAYIANTELDSITKYLKGIKGVNIDEPDDLQKRFALLDKKVSGLELERGRYKNNEVLYDHFRNWIEPFLKELRVILDQTKKYFKQCNIILLIDGDQLVKEFTLTGNLSQIISNSLANVKEGIQVVYVLKDFDKAGLNSFDIQVSIELKFFETAYELYCRNTNSKIGKSYLEYLTVDEIKEIVTREGKNLADMIEKKIEEGMN
ncbi:MAG: Fic family protein [Crocinitomicaceae bacterium]|jgi:Fic family protein|nr:Fic family protein [Crocinitomicaceae bacterium]